MTTAAAFGPSGADDGDRDGAVDTAVAATDGVVLVPPDEPPTPVTATPARPSRVRWSLRRTPSTRRSLSAAAEEPYVAPTEALLFLQVRPFMYALVWWAMVVVHTFTAVLLTLQARLYVYLTDPRMAYFVNLVEPDIGSKYTAVAAVFGVLSAFHWRTVFLLVSTSIRQRKYAFFPADHYEMTPFVKPPTSDRPVKWWQRILSTLKATRLAIWGRRGLLGVESTYFYPYFYLREFIELTSQIWQAYRGSLLVSRPWINHLSVGIIVANCWLTPALQMGYKQRPAVRRIAILALDAVLDFLTAIVVPLSIFVPYFLEFSHSTRSFSLVKMYDERWFVSAVLENQEFLIVSVADLVFKCIPHISITGCLKKVRLLLIKDTSVRAAGDDARRVYRTVVTPSARRDLAQAKMDRIRETTDRARAEHPRSQAIARVKNSHKTRWLSRLTHKYANKLLRVAFVLVGCTILGVHLRGVWTSHKADKVGCKQEIRPWFAPVFACSVFEFDCQRLNITGSDAEVRDTLTTLYTPAIAALVFTHCPALEMPTAIRAFSNLMRLDIYNSAITRWEENAALTDSDHPSLATLTLARVRFPSGELPAGLISPSFPVGLRNIEITQTNLVELPADLHDRWHHSMNRVFIEHSNLTQFPQTLFHLHTEKLSLEGNAIASLDPAWLTGHAHNYLTLGLSCNPQLTELPSAIHRDTSIRSLRLHSTNLSALPDWINDASDRVRGMDRVFASRTPLCGRIDRAPASTRESSLVAAQLLSCTPNDLADDISRSVCGLYPLSIVDAKRSQTTSP